LLRRTPKAWTYVPFNGGPRICVGQNFAMTEMAFARESPFLFTVTFSGLISQGSMADFSCVSGAVGAKV
jgi:hypothetical protein